MRRGLFVCQMLLVSAYCYGFSNQLLSAVKPFLRPQEHVEQLKVANVKSGKAIARQPAIVEGNFVSPTIKDIAFASSIISASGEKVLRVRILHPLNGKLQKVFEHDYPSSSLFSQHGRTVGFQKIRLDAVDRDSLLVITDVGAALGGEIQIWNWKENSFENIVPKNGGGHQFNLLGIETQPKIVIDYRKYPSDSRAAKPTVFVWNDDRFGAEHR